MARLIYTAITSLDGYVSDAEGNWDWSIPDEDVHSAINDLERQVGTLLLGRRMYEVLVAWETMETEGEPVQIADYAEIWRAADKIVYSRSLDEVSSARTKIEPEFDAAAVRSLKGSAERDLSIGGPMIAGEAIAAGLVDECNLFVSPVVVGGGTRALPEDMRWNLDLSDTRSFANGVVHLRYFAGSESA